MSEEPQNVRSTVESIARGDLSSKQWVDHCLSRIESNKSLGCWSFIDADRARERADQLDSLRKDGSALGKLHGCPIGLKDIIEVKDMPHGCGSPAMGQISTKNATLVDASAKLDREWDEWKEANPKGSGNKMGDRGDRNF